MRILHDVDHEEGFTCEVVGCGNPADHYVTDETEDGEGYICHKCNEEDEAAKIKGWEYPNRRINHESSNSD